MLKFITSKMKVQPYAVTFLLIVIFSEGGADQNSNHWQLDDAVPDEYILTGTVMDDESALKAFEREAMMTYQLNLPKYLEQIQKKLPKGIEKPSTGSNNYFNDRNFATVGSLATLDASIVFGEGLKNLRLIFTQHAGRPRPLNDQIHNRVQS